MALPQKYEGLSKSLEIVVNVLTDVFGVPGSGSAATWGLEKALEMFPSYTLKMVLNRISFNSLGIPDNKFDSVFEQTRIALNSIDSEDYNSSVFCKDIFTKNCFNPVTISDEIIVSLELGEEEKSDVLKAVRYVLAVYLLHWTEEPDFPLETRQALQALGNTVKQIYLEIDVIKKNASNQEARIEKLEKSDRDLIPIELTVIPKSIILIGRESAIHEIMTQIDSNQIVCLYADGGLGKTTVAKFIVNEIRNRISKGDSKYHHVAWITSSGKIREDLLQIKIIASDTGSSKEERFENIGLFLQSNSTFLVIDNMDNSPTNEDANFFNTISGKSSLLITTRAIIDGFSLYKLPPLSRDDSVVLFYFYYFRDKDITSLDHDLLRTEKETGQIKDVYRIVDATKGNTLLIELIAKTAHADALSIVELWKKISTNIFGLDSKTEVSTDHSVKYQESKLSIDEQIRRLYSMTQLSEKQKEILSFVSLFPAEHAIFSDVFKWAGFFDQGANDIQDLVDKGWLIRGDGYYLIHTIVRESIRIQNRESGIKVSILKYETLIREMTDIDDYISKPMNSNLALQRVSIPQTIGSLLYETNASNPIIGDFFHNLAELYHKQGKYEDALNYYKKALEIRKKNLGEDHPDTAATYNNMAAVYYDLGNYTDALSNYTNAINIYKHMLGEKDQYSATIYNNIATLYHTIGSNEEALKNYLRAIEINEETDTVGYASSVKLYNNFASYYLSQNNYTDAIKYYKMALKFTKKASGIDASDLATYSNLANLLSAQGNYTEALKLYNSMLKFCEKTLGKDHPDTAKTYEALAGLYRNTSDYDKALIAFTQALKILEKSLGLLHPDTMEVYNNLAGLYVDQKKYDEALKYYKFALSIREKVIGENHPSTASTYNNIATLYYALGRYDEALEYFYKAIYLTENALGKDHPYVATIYFYVAELYLKQNNYTHALKFYKMALEIREKILGIHPDTATTYERLAELYFKMGELEESNKCKTRAEEIKKKLGGE